jgi:hypothetical protein
MIRVVWFVPLLLTANAVRADDNAQAAPVAVTASVGAKANAKAGATKAKADSSPKMISGMSILGNQEAPKSLVIVPWKSSEIGDSIGLATLLDDSRRPVDRDVFMRELAYYEVRSGSK